jgi:osmoprotectant transport system ATP-binding protein
MGAADYARIGREPACFWVDAATVANRFATFYDYLPDMITFESVSKVFPGGTTAVDDLNLEIPTGELTILVGPSGCGKTTTLRMINRLEEATQGTIELDGENINAVDRIVLRRGIGYVMQHSGLFPHRKIRDNIATVPNLLKHDRKQTYKRVDELMELVGLDPALAERYPHQLSGGQQQRVGVARALAADPPIMLMDEPFAAVDPIVRGRLQDEFLSLQQRLQKTIVFVTHDIDEAIKLGDRIAIFQRGGKLAQYATPREMLAAPADDFVTYFLGGERELKRLAIIRIETVCLEPGPAVGPDTAPGQARATARGLGREWVIVLDAEGRPTGWLACAALDDGAATLAGQNVQPFNRILNPEESLRTAASAIVSAQLDAVPVAGDNGCYLGCLDLQTIQSQLL